jgi:hypothetical protein
MWDRAAANFLDVLGRLLPAAGGGHSIEGQGMATRAPAAALTGRRARLVAGSERHERLG